MKSFTESFLSVLEKKCVEPEKRIHAGNFGYVFHKHPIKDGITPRDVMLRQASELNPLSRRLQKQ